MRTLSSLRTDRRRHPRYAGDGLEVLANGAPCQVLDVSVGGVRLAGTVARDPGAVVHLHFFRAQDQSCADILGQVLSSGQGGCRMVFVQPRYSLVKFVLSHARDTRAALPFGCGVN